MTKEAKAEVERQLRENQKAVQRAQEESRRIHEALKESRRVRRDAMPKLKKAGYVR